MKLIALLTDFGLADHYVGTMKGVIHSIEPAATITDITHGVHHGDARSGAFQLLASYKYFPKGTVFTVVVDPGVGTERKGIIVRTEDYLFLGPDNGLLSYAFQKEGGYEARELSNADLRVHPVSKTFHGRDIFAPAAAHYLAGVAFEAFGATIEPMCLNLPTPQRQDNGYLGHILHIDHFGNIITSLSGELLQTELATGNKQSRFIVKSTMITALCETFGDLPTGGLGALLGSSGLVEIVVNGESAARRIGAQVGDVVTWQVLAG